MAAGGARRRLVVGIDLGTTHSVVAWAERDRLLLTSRQAPRAARMLPRARHVILRGCGHVPMWDDPGQVARVLLEASADG